MSSKNTKFRSYLSGLFSDWRLFYVATSIVLLWAVAAMLPRDYFFIRRILGCWLLAAILYSLAIICPPIAGETPESTRGAELITRVSVAIGLAGTSGVIGSQYGHLCMSGVKWLEATATLGIPLIVLTCVLAGGLRLRSLMPAVILIVTTGYFQRPYLNWAHGETTRWEETFDSLFLSKEYNNYKYQLVNKMQRDHVEALLGPGTRLEQNEHPQRENWRDGEQPGDEFLSYVLKEGEGFQGYKVTLQFRNDTLINLNGNPKRSETASK